MRHHDESSNRREGPIWLALAHHCSSLKEVGAEYQGWSLEAGADAQAIEESRLLACFKRLVQPVIFITEPRTSRPGLVPPTMNQELLNQSLIKKMPVGLPAAQYYGGIPQMKHPPLE